MPAKIEVGGKAPSFRLPHDSGGEVSLADFKGRKLVLYFYPKADTPGCTMEGKSFSKLAPAFSRAGTAILGVSADPVPKQGKFKAKHDLSIMLNRRVRPPKPPVDWSASRPGPVPARRPPY